ncbi:MAG: hypothetical protein ABI541_01645 [Betaproteobacteria bacterium]
MGIYVNKLLESELPFEAWVAALIWVALYIASRWIAQSLRAANGAQHAVTVEDWSALRRSLEPKYAVAQILVAGIVFLLALMLGRPAFVFFAGGMIVASACGLGLSAQGLFTARAMARPNAVNGSVTFSTASAFRHMAHRAGGAAVVCLLIGLVLAHVALLGGALFLASTGNGYLRKARAHSQKAI